MSKTPVQVMQPHRLPQTVQTLRQFGLFSPSSKIPAALTIAPYPFAKSSHIPRKVGRSIPTLLVPESTTPAKTLALIRKLGASSPGPFFAAGKAGQINAALFAAACLAPRNPKIRKALDSFRSRQTSSVPLCP
jgi:phosphoribosylcarboxyaminoimidazole (NCAIR) mutase